MSGAAHALAETASLSFGEAIDAYEMERRGNDGETKARSDAETVARLRRFFPAHEIVAALTERRAREIYDAYRTTPTVRTGKPPAADTHRNVLAEAKTFLRWCVGAKLARANALETVDGVGRRSKGKKKLRIDEARAWLGKAIERANAGNEYAVAAMMTMLTGLRATEVAIRAVRDVDDDGWLLWIDQDERPRDEDGLKTAKSDRTIPVPEILRPYLLALTSGRPGQARLFTRVKSRHSVYKAVVRICRAAKVSHTSAHGMRGLYTTLAVLGTRGLLRAIADDVGHESETTTVANYIDPAALAKATQRAALKMLQGGRKGTK